MGTRLVLKMLLNITEIVNFISLNYTKCDLGEPVMMNDQSGNSKDVTSGYCNNSPMITVIF